MNNFIQNASRSDIITGHHADAGENSMLIQIVDFFDTFPTPKYNFKEVLQFKFDDVLDGPTACTDLQAQELANALQRAKEQHMNVIVHCFAGLCRSGAVTEVGIMLGFNPPDCVRIPNSAVKNKMLKVLGIKIDESTSVFAQEFYNREFD
jgi:protein tyrosine phosphatase